MSGLAQNRKSLRGHAQGLVIALVASLLVLLPGVQQPAFAAGVTPNDGTCDLTLSNSEYLISDADELREITDCVTTSNVVFKLDNDIAYTDNRPIGYESAASTSVFSGVLDGASHSITGINISASNSTLDFRNSSLEHNGLGLFWGLGDATFKNLSVRGSVSADFGEDVGGLVGKFNSDVTLSNVVLEMDVTSNVDRTGGFAGSLGSSGTLIAESVELRGSVSSSRFVGGLLGENLGPVRVSDLDIFSAVTGSGVRVGGLIGWARQSIEISDSTNWGQVSGPQAAGGFVGWSDQSVEITGSTNKASVSGGDETAGFIGSANRAGNIDILDSSNEGDVSSTGTQNVAGFVGYSERPLTIRNSVNSGQISSAGSWVGGFTGYVYTSVEIAGSTNSGDISGSRFVGGLVAVLAGDGTLHEMWISGSANTGKVTGGDWVSGFIGAIDVYDDQGPISVDIRNSSNSGDIAGDDYVAGFIGAVIDDEAPRGPTSPEPAEISISGLANMGDISGDDYIGGLVGDAAESSVEISGSSSVGNVTATGEYVGGIAGALHEAVISRVFVSGNISSPDIGVGGVVGYLSDASTITDALVTATISSSGMLTGGILGDTGVAALVTIENALFAGAFEVSDITKVGALYGGDGGGPETFASSSYWTLTENSDLNAAAPSASFSSVATSYLLPAEAVDVDSYVGWDFVNIWGFGTCDVNRGLPMLRFADAGATSDTPLVTSICSVQQGTTPVTGPSATYDGPVIDFVSATVGANQQAEVRGTRLNLITQVLVGGQEVSFSLANGILRFQAPNLPAGNYQVVFVVSSIGLNLTAQITVVGGQAAAVAGSKVNVGSFNGKIVVYALGHDRARISWKVAGRWGVANAVGSNLNRFDRPVGAAGRDVIVEIYVDRVLALTKVVRTR